MQKNKTELRIQQDCFMWFHNAYPHLRGLFFRIKNENTNRISGAIGKATGIIPGVADSCLLIPHIRACFIEFKTPTGRQSKTQNEWADKVKAEGHLYYIVRSLDEFKNLCHRYDSLLKQQK